MGSTFQETYRGEDRIGAHHGHSNQSDTLALRHRVERYWVLDLGTFCFAWVPGKDFLGTSPTGIISPAGWKDAVTHAGSTDGYAIQWVALSAASDVSPSGTLRGFSFTGTDAPAAIFGNSIFFPSTPVLTSFVYAGFEFAPTTTACFLPGTHILTGRGEVVVEKLQVSDAIETRNGRARPLCWIGYGRALTTRGRRSAATPVIVHKGALGENLPNRDLHVTKGHSLYFDDVLSPIEFLANHRSITWNDRAQEVTVYHLELDTHDILLANGAPAESYRDNGNRWLFRNANAAWDFPPKPPYAPG